MWSGFVCSKARPNQGVDFKVPYEEVSERAHICFAATGDLQN